MNGIEEIAKLFKNRDNPDEYGPVFGRIEALPDLKIRLNDKILLSADNIKSLVDVDITDADGKYIYLNKQVALLPYKNNNQYLLLGVIANG